MKQEKTRISSMQMLEVLAEKISEEAGESEAGQFERVLADNLRAWLEKWREVRRRMNESLGKVQ